MKAAHFPVLFGKSSVPAPRLSFSGSLTVEAGSAGPHFTLVVNGAPAGVTYTFAKTADASGKFTLATDQVTVTDSAIGGPYSATFTATPSDSPTHPTLTETYSSTVVDTTAPVLTSPTGTQTGSTTATLGVTTNEGSSPDSANGTLYAVASTSATPPNAAQIIAGHDSTGGTPAFVGTPLAVSTTGAKTFSATGLVASTTYYAYFVQVDAQGNTSAVASSSSFTTASSFTVLSLGAKLAAWYKADAGVTLNVSTASAVADQSGNGVTLSQATAGRQPAYQATGLNGLPTLKFTAASNTSLSSGATAIAMGKAAGAVFVLGQMLTGTGGSGRAVSFIGSGHTADFENNASAVMLGRDGTNNNFEWDTNNVTDPMAVSLATTVVMGNVYDGVAGTLTPYLNGVAGTPGSDGGFVRTMAATGMLTVGDMKDNANACWDGPIREIIVLNDVPTGTEITNIVNYLKSRGGI